MLSIIKNPVKIGVEPDSLELLELKKVFSDASDTRLQFRFKRKDTVVMFEVWYHTTDNLEAIIEATNLTDEMRTYMLIGLEYEDFKAQFRHILITF